MNKSSGIAPLREPQLRADRAATPTKRCGSTKPFNHQLLFFLRSHSSQLWETKLDHFTSIGQINTTAEFHRIGIPGNPPQLFENERCPKSTWPLAGARPPGRKSAGGLNCALRSSAASYLARLLSQGTSQPRTQKLTTCEELCFSSRRSASKAQSNGSRFLSHSLFCHSLHLCRAEFVRPVLRFHRGSAGAPKQPGPKLVILNQACRAYVSTCQSTDTHANESNRAPRLSQDNWTPDTTWGRDSTACRQSPPSLRSPPSTLAPRSSPWLNMLCSPCRPLLSNFHHQRIPPSPPTKRAFLPPPFIQSPPLLSLIATGARYKSGIHCTPASVNNAAPRLTPMRLFGPLVSRALSLARQRPSCRDAKLFASIGFFAKFRYFFGELLQMQVAVMSEV